MEALAVSVAFLACVCCVNLLVTFGLVRKLRQGGFAAAKPLSLPEPGTRVKPFQASTLAGDVIDQPALASSEGVVLFVSATCAPCKRLVTELLATPLNETLIFFVTGDDEAAYEQAEALRSLGTVAVIGHDSDVRSAFDVTAFPTLLRIVGGVIVSAGFGLSEIGVRRKIPAVAVAS